MSGGGDRVVRGDDAHNMDTSSSSLEARRGGATDALKTSLGLLWPADRSGLYLSDVHPDNLVSVPLMEETSAIVICNQVHRATFRLSLSRSSLSSSLCVSR